jgi:hypothetical protein
VTGQSAQDIVEVGVGLDPQSFARQFLAVLACVALTAQAKTTQQYFDPEVKYLTNEMNLTTKA